MKSLDEYQCNQKEKYFIETDAKNCFMTDSKSNPIPHISYQYIYIYIIRAAHEAEPADADNLKNLPKAKTNLWKGTHIMAR